MSPEEKRLLNDIKNYAWTLKEIEWLKKKVEAIAYKVTPTYGLGGGSGSFNGSKVETFGTQKVDLQREIAAKKRKLKELREAINETELTKRERDLIDCVMRGYSLSAYAEKENIYRSQVYKIRDSAVKKVARYIKSTKCVIC